MGQGQVLVEIHDDLMINTRIMDTVTRNGNSTVILLADGRMHDVWDELRIVWNRILKAMYDSK